ncbi:MAG: NADH-quinone oxidoreductase subunit M [Isosphaeraceae bacterium]
MPTLLVITILLPLAGALALFAMPRLPYTTARWVGLGFVLATLALTAVLVSDFDPGQAGPQFAFTHQAGTRTIYGLDWIGYPDIRFATGLDGLSIGLFALTSFLMIATTFASWESIRDRAATHYALLLALESGLLGLFASLDVVLFYIFFEFTLIPLFFLIGLYGGPERRRASITFFLYTLVGSLLTLVGVISLVMIHAQCSADRLLTFSIPELAAGLGDPGKLAWPDWWRAHAWGEWGAAGVFSGEYWGQLLAFFTSPQVLIFLLLFAGFAIKVPLFPFHTWLPLAHVEAPTAGSIVLAGVLLKLGGYGLMRFNLAMTPLGGQALFPMLAFLSVAGIIYGALTALAQTDIKKLVAYSSVSHMGFVTLGLFAFNRTGLEGALIQMINHGLTTGALFACVGVIYERYHTREMGEFGGLWDRMPLFAFFLILSSLGSAAVPGLNGFVGEFPILAAMFARDWRVTAFATIGMVLGAYYLLVMLQKTLFGPLREPGNDASHGHGHDEAHSAVRRLGWHEVVGLGSLMVPIVLLGVYPAPVFDQMKPATTALAARFRPALPSPPPRQRCPRVPQPPAAAADAQDIAR